MKSRSGSRALLHRRPRPAHPHRSPLPLPTGAAGRQNPPPSPPPRGGGGCRPSPTPLGAGAQSATQPRAGTAVSATHTTCPTPASFARFTTSSTSSRNCSETRWAWVSIHIYRTSAPGARSPSTVRRLRPSPSLAAKSMPSDSSPRSFAGFKFATTTMLFPTSSSGL